MVAYGNKVIIPSSGTYQIFNEWCFGLYRQQFRQMNICCLDDIVQAVNTSATLIVAQLVGFQTGETIIPTFNWSDHFNKYTTKMALKGIKKMQHLHISHHFPGQVKVKNDCDGTGRTIDISKEPSWQPTATELPNRIIPPGLSLEHQWYLFKKVREYCPDHCKDLVCPRPVETLS